VHGLPQGGPLSPLWLLLLLNPRHRAIARRSPELHAVSCVDDRALHGLWGEVEDALQVTAAYDDAALLANNWGKTKIWHVGRKKPVQHQINGVAVKSVHSFEWLGMQFHTAGTLCCQLRDDRLRAAEKVVERIGCMPLPMDVRAELIGQCAIPRVTWACGLHTMVATEVAGMRRRIMGATWGHGRALRAAEIVRCVLLKGHRVDPVLAAACGAIQVWRKWARQRPLPGTATSAEGPEGDERPIAGWARALALARRYDERGQLPPVAGVARRIAQVAAVLRCTLDTLHDLVVRDESPARAGHDVRELARQADLAALVRRPDMQGLQGGVDVAATAALYRQGMPSAYEQGLLRSVLAGAVRTQVRQFKADFVPAPTCLVCSDGPDGPKTKSTCVGDALPLAPRGGAARHPSSCRRP
jgi:hypothetical protein